MFLFRKVKKRVPKTPNEVKEALERYLANSSPQLVKWLVSFWKDQQTVLTSFSRTSFSPVSLFSTITGPKAPIT